MDADSFLSGFSIDIDEKDSPTPFGGEESYPQETPGNLDQNVVSSIDGANALKLDESLEIKNTEDQNTLIDSFESNEENKILEQKLTQTTQAEQIPSGVSIESASYIENNSEFTEENTAYKDSLNDANSNEEEYTPKLFTDDQNQKETEQRDIESESGSHQLFDQDVNEDEDFEIPAFLRRQKF